MALPGTQLKPASVCPPLQAALWLRENMRKNFAGACALRIQLRQLPASEARKTWKMARGTAAVAEFFSAVDQVRVYNDVWAGAQHAEIRKGNRPL